MYEDCANRVHDFDKGSCLIVSFSAVPAVCLLPGTIHASKFSESRIVARYAKAGQYEKTMELF
jgi:hypothetical protein